MNTLQCPDCDINANGEHHPQCRAKRPEWVVRVGREGDPEGYSYVRYPNETDGLTSEAAQAYLYPDEKSAWAAAIYRTHGHAFNRNGLQVERDYLTIVQVGTVEDILCAMVDCSDFDHYRSLPQVVSYRGTKLGKTGWNSDTNHAHYQSNALMVRVERK